MIPTWLALGDLHYELPVSQPLPVRYERSYTDGSDGTVIVGSGADWAAGWPFIDCGVRLEEGYGIEGTVPVLRVTLVKPNVFGFILFDWFNPPGENKILPQYPNNVLVGAENGIGTPDLIVFADEVAASAPAFGDAVSAFTPTFGPG